MDALGDRARAHRRQLDGRPGGDRGRAARARPRRRPGAAVPGRGLRAPRLPAARAPAAPRVRPAAPLARPRARSRRSSGRMFADRDLVDPSVADVVVDEFERIYRTAGRAAGLPRLRALDLPRPAVRPRRASTRASPQLEPPALFVWGSHDKLIPPGLPPPRRALAARRRADRARGLRPRARRSSAPERTQRRCSTRFFAQTDADAARLAGAGADSASHETASARPSRAPPPSGDHVAARPAAASRTATAGADALGARGATWAGRRARRSARSARGAADPGRRPRRARPGLHPRVASRACGCSPRCTSAPRCAGSATSPRRGRSCSSATTPAAT